MLLDDIQHHILPISLDFLVEEVAHTVCENPAWFFDVARFSKSAQMEGWFEGMCWVILIPSLKPISHSTSITIFTPFCAASQRIPRPVNILNLRAIHLTFSQKHTGQRSVLPTLSASSQT
jgi:hypothetical protein